MAVSLVAMRKTCLWHGVALSIIPLLAHGLFLEQLRGAGNASRDLCSRWAFFGYRSVGGGASTIKSPYSFAVATDGTMIFSDGGPGCTSAATGRLEDSMFANGAVLNTAKNIDDALDATLVST